MMQVHTFSITYVKIKVIWERSFFLQFYHLIVKLQKWRDYTKKIRCFSYRKHWNYIVSNKFWSLISVFKIRSLTQRVLKSRKDITNKVYIYLL